MATYRFQLCLTSAQILAYYRGDVRSVLVQTQQGLRLQIDLHHFRPYIQSEGITGQFELITATNDRFLSLKKIN